MQLFHLHANDTSLWWFCPEQGLAWGWIVTEGIKAAGAGKDGKVNKVCAFRGNWSRMLSVSAQVLRCLKIPQADWRIWHRLEIGCFLYNWKGCSNRTCQSSCCGNAEKPLCKFACCFWFFQISLNDIKCTSFNLNNNKDKFNASLLNPGIRHGLCSSASHRAN